MTRADRVELIDLSRAADDFAADVRDGLTSTPKALNPRYFYDDLGSILFEAICRLPEYYVSRIEDGILASSAGDIVAAMEAPIRLVELGSGAATKTRHLIAAALQRQAGLSYIPIDIDRSMLRGTSDALAAEHEALRLTAIAGSFDEGVLAAMRLPAHLPGERTLVLFLGSTIGNLEPEARHHLLLQIRSGMRDGDAMLIGADQDKSEAILIPAYDDVLGVTAAFNRNVLGRINRELGGTFDVASFHHRAWYDRERKRIEMHLVSDIAQRITVRESGIEVDFTEGESIHTESSYKFTRDAVATMAADTGFRLTRQWTDTGGWFADYLLTAT
ncbi:MAG: L-histidine N(alpha)-methyltransferase [Acidobacteriota bacterium]|nr:L-histidine N(alpha)-methyltransferase [Acidobacteriota bacterium]